MIRCGIVERIQNSDLDVPNQISAGFRSQLHNLVRELRKVSYLVSSSMKITIVLITWQDYED